MTVAWPIAGPLLQKSPASLPFSRLANAERDYWDFQD
jgi:hypothetical protein